MKKAKIIKLLIVLFNVFLAVFIISRLWPLVFSKTVTEIVKLNESPEKIINIIGKDKNGVNRKGIDVVVFFNDAPVIEDIESLNKVYSKYKRILNFQIFFRKKFKTTTPINFPFKNVPGRKVFCEFDKRLFNSNYYVVLKDSLLVSIGIPTRARELNFDLEKIIDPNKGYQDYAISTNKLKLLLIEEIKKGNKEFLNLTNEKYESFKSFDNFDRIYVVSAECTSCQLKSLLKDIALRQVLSKGHEMLIFPIHSSEIQLKEIMKQEHISFPIYHDYHDGFNLFSVISGVKSTMITIDKNEWKKE